MIAVGGKSMYFVYVVGRSDGLHKIGVTGHVLDRCEALSKLYPRHRPIRLVRSFDLGMDAPLPDDVPISFAREPGEQVGAPFSELASQPGTTPEQQAKYENLKRIARSWGYD